MQRAVLGTIMRINNGNCARHKHKLAIIDLRAPIILFEFNCLGFFAILVVSSAQKAQHKRQRHVRGLDLMFYSLFRFSANNAFRPEKNLRCLPLPSFIVYAAAKVLEGLCEKVSRTKSDTKEVLLFFLCWRLSPTTSMSSYVGESFMNRQFWPLFFWLVI